MSKQINTTATTPIKDGDKISYTETKTTIEEREVVFNLTELFGRRKTITKAITATEQGKVASLAKADKTIEMLNGQLAVLDVKIQEAKDFGLADDE